VRALAALGVSAGAVSRAEAVSVVELGVVTRSLLAIARDVVADDRGLAAQIGQSCVDGLEVDGGSISLLTATESRQTLWASDEVGELLEDLQFSLGEGACMEAAATGRPVLVEDLHDSMEAARWPMFAASVAERTQVRALFALPLQWGSINLGVMDLYRLAAGGLSSAQYRDAITAADTAALMMLGQRTDPHPARRDDPAHRNDHHLPEDDRSDGDGRGRWLEHAVSHRAEIHQATGMVLAQLGISATEALARLRGYAFVEQRLLIDVARDVVARRLRFTEDMR
jgi:ANTAR domain